MSQAIPKDGTIPKLPRKRIVFLAVLLAILLSFLLIDRSQYDLILGEKVSSIAEQQGVLLLLQEPRSHFWGLCSEVATLRPKGFPFPVEMKDFCLSAQPLAALAGRLSAHAKGVLSEGKFHGEFSSHSPTSAIVSGSLRGLSLAEFPLTQSTGFSDGELSMQILTLSFQKGHIERVLARVALDDVEKPINTLLPLRLGGMPMTITIPSLLDTQLSFQVRAEGKEVEFSEIAMQSNLLRLKGRYFLKNLGLNFAINQQSQVEAEFQVQIQPDGRRAFGDILRGFSGGKLGGEEKACLVRLSGLARLPKAEYTPLETFSKNESP